MPYAGALLTGVYACLDGRDWDGLAALLTPDARWTVLPEPSVAGRDAVCASLAAAHPEPVRHELVAVHDEGTAAAVFLAVTQQTADGPVRSSWLDSYRFADGLVAEHVSLRTG